jgi:hypothetical protein
VKYDHQLEKEVKIYRVKLPGPLNLGEGKPENQNDAVIFTRGDAVRLLIWTKTTISKGTQKDSGDLWEKKNKSKLKKKKKREGKYEIGV